MPTLDTSNEKIWPVQLSSDPREQTPRPEDTTVRMYMFVGPVAASEAVRVLGGDTALYLTKSIQFHEDDSQTEAFYLELTREEFSVLYGKLFLAEE